MVSLWHTNVTFSLVVDSSPFIPENTPPQVTRALRFHRAGGYLPPLYKSDFWILGEDLIPINHTTQSLDLYLTFEGVSLFKWQFMQSFDDAFKIHKNYGLSDANTDDVKVKTGLSHFFMLHPSHLFFSSFLFLAEDASGYQSLFTWDDSLHLRHSQHPGLSGLSKWSPAPPQILLLPLSSSYQMSILYLVLFNPP